MKVDVLKRYEELEKKGWKDPFTRTDKLSFEELVEASVLAHLLREGIKEYDDEYDFKVLDFIEKKRIEMIRCWEAEFRMEERLKQLKR